MTETNQMQTKKAVIYCRVSTKEQAEEGNSLVSQERLCREYAAKEGYEVAEVFIERGESAKTAERKELQRMLTFCTSKKDFIHAVIAYKVDRISRNIADYSLIKVRLKKFNVVIKSITEFFEDTPAGRFMENIIANVGQFDNDVRTERAVGGMREATLEGRYVWKAPTGFSNTKVNGKCTIKPNEYAPLVKEAFELIATRMYSTEEVRLKMVKKGLVNNKGNPIHHSHFFLILRNPMYKGKIKKFGKEFQGTFDPIVSEELFDLVQAILKRRKFNSKFYLHDNPDFPLRRFVINDDGKQITGYWSQGRNLKYPYYSFTKPGTTIRKEELERKFMLFLSQYSFDTIHLKEMRTYLIKYFEKKANKTQQNIGSIQSRINEINSSIDNLIKLESRGSISTTILEDRVKQFDNELYELKKLLINRENTEVNIPQLLKFAAKSLNDIAYLWKISPSEIQKQLQRFEFPEGIIFNGMNFRTATICSVFKAKELIDGAKSIIVPSEYGGKNTMSGTKLPPSGLNLLETKAFWEEVVAELVQLERILSQHSSPEQVSEVDT
ncbi:MAG: hypothetical protein JWP45_3586 [Mucilaginibacter sp.]|nr:hypothetical protein [Mucilaginibacter sp.]